MNIIDKIINKEYEVILLDKDGFTQPQIDEFGKELLMLKLKEKLFTQFVMTCPNKIKDVDDVQNINTCFDCHLFDFCSKNNN